jgi:hypothetical protein
MGALYFLLGIVVIALVTAVLIGWLVPLIIGIVKLFRRTGGIALTIIGIMWALGAMGLAVMGYVAISHLREALRVEDFDPAAFKGQTGSVTLPHQGESSLIVTDRKANKRLRLHVREGVAQAPVGDYKVDSYEISMKDKAGVTWTASHYSSPSQGLEISAASAAHLNLGPPFTARVEVNESPGGGTMLQFSLTGPGGESYVMMSGRGRPALPRFEVLDPSGQVVWQGRFEYG